jgi:hypothetical protein
MDTRFLRQVADGYAARVVCMELFDRSIKPRGRATLQRTVCGQRVVQQLMTE